MWRYDDAGRPRSEAQRHADGWSWQLAHRRNRLGVIEASHYGEAPPIDWLSYGPGHLHGLTIGEQSLEIERDELHREIHRASGHWAVVRSYDTAGRLAAWQLNGTGPNEHQPAWLRQYQYDATGRPQAIEDSRYGAIGYRYDPAGRLTGSRHGQTEHRYGFDAAGNRISRAHGASPGDADSWAAEVRARLPDQSFNVLGRGRHTSGPTHCWPDNRILELDGTRYAYDAWGNLAERIAPDGAKLELSWDGADRLIALWQRDADGHISEATYAYDALGRRIRKQVAEPDGESLIRFGWEANRQVAEDINGELTRTVVYEPESFVPLARIEAWANTPQGEEDWDDRAQARAMLSQVKHQLLGQGLAPPEELVQAQRELDRSRRLRIGWFHTDHLGTPLALTDGEGKPLWYGRPDDWGAVADTCGSVSQRIRFQGQYYDPESGLYYNRHRYYDPGVGRYISEDPIGLTGGLNLYTYVDGNPISYIDPEGLRGWPQGSIYRGTGDIHGQIWNANQMRNGAIQNYPSLKKRAEKYWGGGSDLHLPNNKPWCRIVCPDEGNMCRPPPRDGLPSITNPGCYEVCVPGPFIGPR